MNQCLIYLMPTLIEKTHWMSKWRSRRCLKVVYYWPRHWDRYQPYQMQNYEHFNPGISESGAHSITWPFRTHPHIVFAWILATFGWKNSFQWHFNRLHYWKWSYVHPLQFHGSGNINLMKETDISFYCVMSFLGYSLLPMLILAGFGILFSLNNAFGVFSSLILAAWSSKTAGSMISLALNREGIVLIAYPLFLFYLSFALIIIFWVC